MPTVEIETFCRVIRAQVRLVLKSDREQKGEIVEGKPIDCGDKWHCAAGKPDCLLNCLRIETRRR